MPASIRSSCTSSLRHPAPTTPYTLSLTTLFRSTAPRRARRPQAQAPALGQRAAIYLQPERRLRSRLPRLPRTPTRRSEEHTSELQSRGQLVCRLLLEKKKLRRRNP